MNNLQTVQSTESDLSIIEQNRLGDIARHYQKNALAESTRKRYKSDFKIFVAWCDSLNLISLPAAPDTVSKFLASQSFLKIKPATLVRRLAAIKLAHESSGYVSPTQHKGVSAVLKGIKREQGSAQNKKAPLTAERLKSVIAHCPDTLIGLRDKSLLLLGFAGAFRRSELVALTVKDIERTAEGIKVTIRKSKTDQEGRGQIIAILNGTRFRVADALTDWINAARITEGYIFRAIKKGGHLQSVLTGQSVAKIVKHYAAKVGLTVSQFSAHSLRAGFITSGAAAGADIFKLMEVSRHKKPETVLGYVRESKLFENHAGESFL